MFGNVKVSSAERSAWGHEACYKSSAAQYVRLNKINSFMFIYCSLLVSVSTVSNLQKVFIYMRA